MQHYHYQDTFKTLYQKAVSLYKAGNQDASSYFSETEKAFIAANGWRVQDFFDYAEDQVCLGEPSYEIAQSIEQVRRDYFLHIQKGIPSAERLVSASLPAKSDSIDGIQWLPRILPKAKGKLLGQLPNEVMYCCGGDRAFLESNNIHPAEFLRVVWANLDNEQGVIDFVKQRRAEAR